jgi:hypothetical protein
LKTPTIAFCFRPDVAPNRLDPLTQHQGGKFWTKISSTLPARFEQPNQALKPQNQLAVQSSGHMPGVYLAAGIPAPRGAAKKILTKVTYICRSPPPKSSYLLNFYLFICFHLDFSYRVFGRFVTRGVKKYGGNPSGHQKQSVAFFPPSFSLPRFFLLDFFIAFLDVS